MRNVIRLGDATSHGGKVIATATNQFKVGGISVACVGDPCTCPMPGHTNCRIATGSARRRIQGRSIAFEGDTTTCGARLIASAGNFKTS
jgi:uncharacterized Zn-binding protein involved in type VI secretion